MVHSCVPDPMSRESMTRATSSLYMLPRVARKRDTASPGGDNFVPNKPDILLQAALKQDTTLVYTGNTASGRAEGNYCTHV